MPKRPLTAAQVNALAAEGTHWVSPGLYVQIKPNGARSWLLRYSRDGKTSWHGLGAVREVGLREARERVEELRVAIRRDGAHPVLDRRAAKEETKVASSTAPTFGWCAEQYIAAHEASWRNEKHRAQWVSTVRDYAGPVIGKLPVDQIGVDEVFEILEPIWTTKSETAGRLRGRISKVLGWAKAKGYRSGDDPAARGGPLDHLLPSLAKVQKVEHMVAVPYRDVPALVVKLQASKSIAAKPLLFLLLTAGRAGEVLGATWDEIDLAERVWVVPAGRMKAGKEHRVPLSDAAVELLQSLPGRDGLVFPGQRKGRPVSEASLRKLLRQHGPDDADTHGLRSSFRDWAAEQTDAPREVAEACLAHDVGSVVERAYRRTTFFDRRRELMAEWAAFATGGEAPVEAGA